MSVKYNKKLSGADKGLAATNENERYNASLNRLENFLTVKEMDRRHWTGENLGNPDGALFKVIAKLFVPLFTLYLLSTAVIYCAIRDAQTLLASAYGYTLDVNTVKTIIVFVSVICIAAIVGTVLIFCKKYYIGSFVTGGSALIMSVHILTQLNIQMPEGSKYKLLFSLSLIAYFILILLCAYLLFCMFKARRTVKKAVQEVLGKISRSSNEMLTPDMYCDKIEAYIEKEKQKIAEGQKGEKYITFFGSDDEFDK